MRRKFKTYNWKELDKARLDSSDPNLEEFHKMLFEIDDKIKAGIKLNLAEKENYCEAIWIADQNGKEGFDMRSEFCCKDYWFKHAWRHYWSDLDGIYTHKNIFTKKKIPKETVKIDLEFLKKTAVEWQKIIDKTNHKESLLNLISKETRREIRKYNEDPKWHIMGFFCESNEYERGMLIIRLRSKYIYLRVQEYFDKNSNKVQLFQFKNRQIEFNHESLLHILNRHYEASRKQAEREKSLHNEDIHPDEIYRIINLLFIQITNQIEKKIDDKKVFFEFKGKKYAIWIKDSHKFIRGTGRTNYQFISTFYPVTQDEELFKIKSNYTILALDEHYSIYVKNNTDGNTA
jgi:hypothetical protein